MNRPRRILMTVDAVGGVWRYALDLAAALNDRGTAVVLVGLGPTPSTTQAAEADALPDAELVWLDQPLDWMVENEAERAETPDQIAAIARSFRVDLLHLNLPSQACGLNIGRPIVAAAHSCLATWWQAMRSEPLPEAWSRQAERDRAGLGAASCVFTPSASHAAAMNRAYGPLHGLRVVYNATRESVPPQAKEPFALAAARWWDEAKNAAVLDLAAGKLRRWPLIMAGAQAGPNGQRAELSHADAPGCLAEPVLREMMSRAAIFVSPSRYEPFGLAVLQAALAESALVVSDIPTYREVWNDAALFVDPNDPDDFANAIDCLAVTPRLRAEMGRRARARALTFTLDRQADAVIDAYAQVLATARLPGAA